ncbi:hypothetical protein AX16_002772 [Volvariella volvacea WC 439]|nr:hypothetical protein AX16_002772 [Volvariella volvacea WC 439]
MKDVRRDAELGLYSGDDKSLKELMDSQLLSSPGLLLPTKVPNSVFYASSYPALCACACKIDPRDISEDLREPVLLALYGLIHGLKEAPESILKLNGWWDDKGSTEMEEVVFQKSTYPHTSYIRPSRDQQKQAQFRAKALGGAPCTILPLRPSGDALEPEHSQILPLEGVEASESYESGSKGRTLILAFRIRATLALALQELDSESNASELAEHVDWVVKFLRSNQDLIAPDDLIEVLYREKGLSSHPVDKRMEKEPKKALATSKRVNPRDKVCFECDAREPVVKLSRCAGCMHVCVLLLEDLSSDELEETQVLLIIACEREEIDNVRLRQPKTAQRWEDWLNWRPFLFHPKIPFHALDLHKDPNRVKTRRMFWRVEYTPEELSYSQKFKYTGVGVFKIVKALDKMDKIQEVKKGEARKCVEGKFSENEGRCKSLSVLATLHLVYSDDGNILPWLEYCVERTRDSSIPGVFVG